MTYREAIKLKKNQAIFIKETGMVDYVIDIVIDDKDIIIFTMGGDYHHTEVKKV